MMMQTANGGTEMMEGCTEYLQLVVDGLKTWAHAYVVPGRLIGRRPRRHAGTGLPGLDALRLAVGAPPRTAVAFAARRHGL